LAESSGLKDEPSLNADLPPKRLVADSCAEAGVVATGVSSVISASGESCVSNAGFAAEPKTLPFEGAGAPNAVDVEGWPKVLLVLPPDDEPSTLDPLVNEANPDEFDTLPPNKLLGPLLAGAAVAKGLALEALPPPKGVAGLAASAPKGDCVAVLVAQGDFG